MKIETKFKPKEEVFILMNNHVKKAKIRTVTITIEEEVSVDYVLVFDDIPGIRVLNESNLFKTKEELLTTL